MSRRLPAALLAVGAAAVMAVLANHPIAPAGATLSSEYPALETNAESGLSIVSTPERASTAQGPAYAAQVPDEAVAKHRPAASTIRPLASGSHTLSSWIARDPEGGVCVLAARIAITQAERPPLAYSCSRADRTDAGAMIEIIEPGAAKVLFAGVAPAGVPDVTVRLADGTSVVVPVKHDAWTAETKIRAVAIVQDVNGVPHESLEGE